MNDQLDMFAALGLDSGPAKSEKEIRIENAYDAAPDGIALVYTASENGNSTGPHFFLTIDDAMKLCSDNRSKGVIHGTCWAFFWTSLKNYCGNYWDLTDGGIDFTNFFDNGSRDELLNELGIKKIDYWEVYDLLKNAGFKIKNPIDRSIEFVKKLLA